MTRVLLLVLLLLASLPASAQNTRAAFQRGDYFISFKVEASYIDRLVSPRWFNGADRQHDDTVNLALLGFRNGAFNNENVPLTPRAGADGSAYVNR